MNDKDYDQQGKNYIQIFDCHVCTSHLNWLRGFEFGRLNYEILAF